jgi:lysophospholipase L1-like esterase
MKRLSSLYLLYLAVCLWCPLASAAPPKSKITVEPPLVFTDQLVTIRLADSPVAETKISYTLKSLSRDGKWTERAGSAEIKDGAFSVQPLREGLHVVTWSSPQNATPLEARFLAINPPAPLDQRNKDALRRTLPRSAAKLLRGEPVTILAMGDSVTATGDYPQMVAMMLSRATGNTKIRVVKKAYSGKSVDATVRHWKRDLANLREQSTPPDIGLLMYGLNEQAAGVPLEAYLEQYEWVARRLNEIGADAVFLQPTPHINIPPWGEDNAAYPTRTLGFGAALAPLANRLNVPLVPTFRAVWDKGSDSLETSARALWPLYPPSYSRQFETLSPEGGKGDTIHLNALGHLQIARAVFETLTGEFDLPPLWISGVSYWTKDGITSSLLVWNVSSAQRQGRLEAVPPTGIDYSAAPFSYNLAPNEKIWFEIKWRSAKKPLDLLHYPFDRYLLTLRPLVPLIDFADGKSRPYVVAAPFNIEAYWQRERWNNVRGAVDVKLHLDRGTSSTHRFSIPNKPVGRFPIVHHAKIGARENWAVGELVFVRYGAALWGEAEVDGDLKEWSTLEKLWVPIGEKVQARWSRGIEDNRATPQECYMRWAFRAGEKGVYFACRATGDITRDSFTLFFDTREPRELGTAGPYFWLDGKMGENGKVNLKKGETSVKATDLRGSWRPTENGADFEIFVPYDLMESASWPQSGDLGLSIVWTHNSADKKITRLMWSENGHPWNTRWFGVVRRINSPEQADALPYIVRVR